MLEHLSWTEFLQRWSREAIAHADDLGLEITPETRASGWIGAPPASAATIAAAEARLGRTLPPSYREFLAITDGWPVLSFDFDEVLPVSAVDWVKTANPGLYDIVCDESDYEWPPDSDDGPPLMNRALMLSTGTDNFLFDTGRVSADGEWATTTWTSWNPGADEEQQPSFRAGLEDHYASFVRFDADDSVTHDEIADRVEDAYQLLLRGDRSEEYVISEAVGFGSQRAEVLAHQLNVLMGQYRAATSAVSLDDNEHAADSALLTDVWPMFVNAALDPRDRQKWALDQAIRHGRASVAALLRPLADQYQRDGGLTPDFSYAPAFDAAVDTARDLARARRDDEAFEVILEALPSWRPLSPMHLAPMGLVWDRDLARIMTQERRARLLAARRGTGA